MNNGYTDYTTAVVVSFTPPTATLANSGPVDEGVPVTVGFSNPSDAYAEDVAAGFHCSFSTSPLGLATSYAAAGMMAADDFTLLDAGDIPIYGRILGIDGGYSDYTTVVTVNDVPPTATLTNSGPGYVGDPEAITFSDAYDISPAATAAGFHYSFATDPTQLASSYAAASPSPTQAMVFPALGTYTVYGRIFDVNNGYSDYMTAVAVDNIPPTASLNNNGPVDVGSPVALTFSDPYDPSDEATEAGFHYSFAINPSELTSSYDVAGLADSASFTFTSQGSFPVYGRILDEGGGYSDYTTSVTVLDVPPTADFTNNGPVNVGSPVVISFTNSYSPSSLDTEEGFHYSFATDPSQLAASYVAASPSPSDSLTFNVQGTYTVYGQIYSLDNESSEYTTTVTVNDVPPTATFINNGPVSVASPTTVSLIDASDPSVEDTNAGFHYSFATDPSQLAGSYANAGTTSSASFTFPERGAYPVFGRIFDVDNNFTDYTTSVTVLDVPPTATFSNTGPVGEGAPFTVSFTNPSDPSAEQTKIGFHYTIAQSISGLDGDWYSSSSQSSATYTFTEGGTYTFYGRIFILDGNYTQYTTVVTVTDVAPTANFANNGPIYELSSVQVSFSNPHSPSVLDTLAGFHYSYATDPSQLASLYSHATTSPWSILTFNVFGTYQVYGRILTIDNEYTDYTTTVSVLDLPPTATFTNNGPVPVGAPVAITFSNTNDNAEVDSDDGFHFSFASDPSQLATSYNTAGTAAVETLTYHAAGTYTIYGDIFSVGNAFTEYTTTVTVYDIPPTADFTNSGPIIEGNQATVSFTNSYSPSEPDTAAGFHYSIAADPSGLASDYASADSNSTSTYGFLLGGTYYFYGRIFAVDNLYTDYSTAVVVNDVPPTATFSNDGPVDAGSPVDVCFTNASDSYLPNELAGFQYSFALDPSQLATTYETAGSSTSAQFTLLNVGNDPVYGRIFSMDEGYTDYTTYVTVLDVPPTAMGVSGPINIGEGSQGTYSLAGASDISPIDNASLRYSFSIDPSQLAGNYNSASSSNAFNYGLDTPGTFTVYAQVYDQDGGISPIYTVGVTVYPVAPTASLGNSGPSILGAPIAVSFSNSYDPSHTETAAGFRYSFALDPSLLAGDYALAESSPAMIYTFSDYGNYQVYGQIISADGQYTDYTTTITVLDAPPIAVFSNDGPVTEGDPVAVSFAGPYSPSQIDTSAGFHYSFAIDPRQLTSDYSTAGTAASAYFTFTWSGTYTLYGRILAVDDFYTDYSTTVTINAVPPTATLTNNSPVNAGSPATIIFADASDIYPPDEQAGFQYSFAIDPTQLATTFSSASASSTAQFTFFNVGTYPVYGRVFSTDNGYTDYTTFVTVNDVPPSATGVSGPTSIGEWSLGTYTLTGTYDISPVDYASLRYSFAIDPTQLAASYSSASTIDSFTYGLESAGTFTVYAQLYDQDGGVSPTYTLPVAVYDVPPTATISNNGPIVLDSPVTVALSNPYDPSQTDVAAGFHYSFALDPSQLAGDYTTAGTSPTASFTFSDYGTYPVYGQIISADGQFSDYTTTVWVLDAPPTASFSNSGPVTEGDPVSVSFADPYSASQIDSAAGFHYSFATDPSQLVADYTSAGTTPSASFTFTWSGTYTLYGRILVVDDIYTDYSTVVTINDVPPTAILTSNSPVDAGSPATITFTDASDIYTPDEQAGFQYSFALDPSQLASTYSSASTSGSTQITFFNVGIFPVYGRVFSVDNGYTDYTTFVTVNDTPPTATGVIGPANIGEWSQGIYTLEGAYDISPVDNASLHYSFASDPTQLATGYSSASSIDLFSYGLESAGTFTVYAQVYDQDGGISPTYTLPVTVYDVPPTASIVNNGPVIEGIPAGVTLSNPYDPSLTDTAAGFHYSFALDPTQLAVGYDTAGTSSTASFAFNLFGTYSVYGRILAADGQYSDYTTSVTVLDTPPTATFSNNGPIIEGNLTTVGFTDPYSPSVPDSSAGFHFSFGNDPSQLSPDYNTAGTSSTISYNFLFSGTYTIYGRILAVDDSYTDYSTVVTVIGIPPTATLINDGPINAGNSATISFTNAYDPYFLDEYSGFQYSFALDPTQLAANYSEAGPSSSIQITFPNPGTYAVYGRILAVDNSYTDYTTYVTVDDVPPAATGINGPASIGEWTLGTYSLADASDISPVDNASLHFSFSTDPTQLAADYGSASATNSFVTGLGEAGTFTVYGQVFDQDGGVSPVYSITVTVFLVPPTATYSNSGPVNEGSSVTVSMSNPYDPSPIDTSAGFHYSFALDPTQLAEDYTTAGTDPSASYTFTEFGTYDVYGRIIASDDQYTDYTTAVIVNDVAPTATLSNSGPITEGDQVSISFTNPYSPSVLDTEAGFHYSFATDPTQLASSYETAGSSTSTTLTFNTYGSYPVFGRIFAVGEEYTDYTTTVTVADVIPTAAGIYGPTVLDQGTSGTFTLTGITDTVPAELASLHYSFALDPSQLAGSYSSASASPQGVLSFPNDGVNTVYAEIYAIGGAVSPIYNMPVTVNHVPPTSTGIDGPAILSLNETGTYSLGGVVELSSQDISSLHYSFALDPSQLASDYAEAGPVNSFTQSFTQMGSYTVYASVYDQEGGISPVYSLPVVVSPQPTVESVEINGGAQQRSRVTQISITFSTEVKIANITQAFELTRISDGATIGDITAAFQIVDGQTVATLSFSGSYTEAGSLADGNWTLTINHADVTANGAAMAADYTQTNIKRLFGDYNGTGDVDSSDLGIFGTTFGLTSSNPGFIAAFDSDGNGIIDSTDLLAFGTRFGHSI